MPKKQLYLCIDRPLPSHLKVEAARLAVEENKINEPQPLVRRRWTLIGTNRPCGRCPLVPA